MKWQCLPITEFDDFAGDWDRVSARAASSAPFMRSIFLRPLLRHFSKGNETIVAAYDKGEPQAAAILQMVRPGMWQTFQPSQLPLGAIVFNRELDPMQVFRGLLSTAPGLSVSLDSPSSIRSSFRARCRSRDWRLLTTSRPPGSKSRAPSRHIGKRAARTCGTTYASNAASSVSKAFS